MIQRLLASYLLNRLFAGRRGRRGHRSRGHRGFPYSPARRGRGQVRVTGCCLPIPLALVVSAAGGLAARRAGH